MEDLELNTKKPRRRSFFAGNLNDIDLGKKVEKVNVAAATPDRKFEKEKIQAKTKSIKSDFDTIEMVPISKINKHRFQARTHFDENEIAELAASIKAHTLLNPIILEQTKNGLEVISGERRLRAFEFNKEEYIPARIMKSGDLRLLSIIDNIQRKDLHPLEEGEAYKAILEEDKDLSIQALADSLGIQRTRISELVGYCTKISNVQKKRLIREGITARSELRALSKPSNKPSQSVSKEKQEILLKIVKVGEKAIIKTKLDLTEAQKKGILEILN